MDLEEEINNLKDKVRILEKRVKFLEQIERNTAYLNEVV
jgi:hypothetical protein